MNVYHCTGRQAPKWFKLQTGDIKGKTKCTLKFHL